MLLLERIKTYLSMVKFSHSVFALPFALTSMLIASQGKPKLRTVFLIVIAMVSARTLSMTLNRIIDKEIDSINPRTREREIPSKRVSLFEAYIIVIVSLIIFILSAFLLNPLCLKLSPLALFFIFIYSYTKRFTWLSHLVLGLTISGAPLGAWIAVKGSFDMKIIPLTVAVVFWIGGFDILYALQDIDFDRRYRLYSIPVRFGIKKSLWISRFFHAFTFLLLIVTGIIFDLGFPYFTGVVICGILLIYEHALVRPDDLSKLDIAFFNMNGYISIIVFISVLLSYII